MCKGKVVYNLGRYYLWEMRSREREKCGYKLQNDQNRDSQRDHLGSAPVEENPATVSWEEHVRHRPLRTFLRRKEGVELCTVDRVSRHRYWPAMECEDGLHGTQTAHGAFRQRIVVGHGDRVDAFLKGYLPNLCQVQLKRGRFLLRYYFWVRWGSTLNSEAHFSYLELSRQFPSVPTLHSHLSFNCAKKKKKCMVFVNQHLCAERTAPVVGPHGQGRAIEGLMYAT